MDIVYGHCRHTEAMAWKENGIWQIQFYRNDELGDPTLCMAPEDWQNWTVTEPYSVIPHGLCANCDGPTFGTDYLCENCRD